DQAVVKARVGEAIVLLGVDLAVLREVVAPLEVDEHAGVARLRHIDLGHLTLEATIARAASTPAQLLALVVTRHEQKPSLAVVQLSCDAVQEHALLRIRIVLAVALIELWRQRLKDLEEWDRDVRGTLTLDA